MTREEEMALRELAAGRCVIQKVIDVLGPMSLWSKHELEKEILKAVAAEREACAELVWPTQQIKVWSDEELAAMTGAFNRAQEKHGWYETIMAVGATALKGRAAAIRSRT